VCLQDILSDLLAQGWWQVDVAHGCVSVVDARLKFVLGSVSHIDQAEVDAEEDSIEDSIDQENKYNARKLSGCAWRNLHNSQSQAGMVPHHEVLVEKQIKVRSVIHRFL